jgi:hypothetical protein
MVEIKKISWMNCFAETYSETQQSTAQEKYSKRAASPGCSALQQQLKHQPKRNILCPPIYNKYNN